MSKTIIFILIVVQAINCFGQKTNMLRPYNGPYGLNIYYPLLTDSKSLTVYEKIENRFQFSKSPEHFRYEFQSYQGKVWTDSITGQIIIKPDTVGGFVFNMTIYNEDSLVDQYKFHMSSEPIPSPTVKFYEHHSGYISSKDLFKLDSVVCVTERFPHFIQYKITQYSISIVDHENQIFKYNIVDAKLPGHIIQQILQCKSGSKIIIDKIIATRLLDNKIITVQPRIICVD